MSIKFTSARLEPQSVETGMAYRIFIGVETYGVLSCDSGVALHDSTGAALHTADGLDYTVPYTGSEIDAAIGGLLSWTTI